MRYVYGLTLAAALIFGCSSSSKSTRTTSNENPSGTPQSGSIEGTASTAGTAANTTGTATASSAQTSNNNLPADNNTATASNAPASNSGATMPNDTSNSTAGNGAPSSQSGTSSTSTYGQDSTGSTGSASGQTPSTSGSTAPSSSGSTYGVSTGSTGSVSGSSDNLRAVVGSVAKVDQNSITLDQSAGGVTLTVDSNTQVLRRGQPIAAGISAIHEGEQVRASFDPASNRADKIEVMGRGKMKHHNAPSNPR